LRNYFYFQASAIRRLALPWYIKDLTTDEIIGPNPTLEQLITWYWAPPVTGLYLIWRQGTGATIAWNSNGAAIGGAYKIQRRLATSWQWIDRATLAASSGSYTDTTIASSSSCFYRVSYSYASATSAPSNQLFVSIYNPSVGPTGNGGAATPFGGTPPPGQAGPHDDPDNDGLTNAEEIEMGADRTKADSDDDGLTDDKDGWPMAKFLKTPRLPVWRYAVVELVNGNNVEPVALNNNGDIIYTDQNPVRAFYRAAGQTSSLEIENTQFGGINPIGSVIGLADDGTAVGVWERTDPSDNKAYKNFTWKPWYQTIEYSGDTCTVPGNFEPNQQELLFAWSSFAIQGITPAGKVYGAGSANAWRYGDQSASIEAFAINGQMVFGYPQPAFVVAKHWIEDFHTDGYANWSGDGHLINNSGDYIFYYSGYTRTGNAPIGFPLAKGYYYSRSGAVGTLVNCGGGVALNDDLHILCS